MTAPAAGAPFRLDPFQLEAIAAIDDGRSVLVAAPTGSGKTVVADAAIDMALHAGGRTFYTTPIKALSNQKYSDLVARLGAGRVGLLTGDTAISGDADVVVMTTEVLRNMLYAGSTALDDLHVVVLDEVHYLQDAYRGPVWEEVIIGLPPSVRLVCLSATVSNAEELGQWIETVRGPTATVIEHRRPVELENLYLVGDRASERDHLLPVLVDGRPNPEGYRFDPEPRPRGRRGGPPDRGRRFVTPRRVETIERLAEEDLLPVIYFIFSRNACDDALAAARDAGLKYTDADQRRRIREIVEHSVSALSDADLDVLGYDMWLAALEQGLAAHHAGLIPAFKEAVERCFVEGLVKVVFATETLALGINMPARSVAIEKLTKYNGETHEFLTPAQFTQLTGRAGRRGIDDEGFSIVLWSPFTTFTQVAELAASREFPLTSSFRPTYNMAANLVRRYERPEALALLGQSFAQYQADRAVVALERRLARDRERLADAERLARCDRGDLDEYATLAERAGSERRHRPDGRAAIERRMSLLRPGDVIAPRLAPEVLERTGRRPDARPRLAVISVAYRARGAIRVRCVDERCDVLQLQVSDVVDPPPTLGEIEIPTPYAPHAPEFLDEVAVRLRSVQVTVATDEPGPSRWERLVAELESHPVHSCPDRDEHLEAHRDLGRLRRDVGRSERHLRQRSSSVVRRFEAVIDVLGSLGFVDGWSLTSAGERLSRIYHERDLLIALALDDGVFDGLDAAGVAAVVAGVVYEDRRPDGSTPEFPTAALARRFGRLERLAQKVNRAERDRGLPLMRPPDAGFMAVCHGWASGRELGPLIDGEMSGGDFVRTVKMVVDVLGQLAEIAPDLGTRSRAAAAVEAIRRGVVADVGPSDALPSEAT